MVLGVGNVIGDGVLLRIFGPASSAGICGRLDVFPVVVVVEVEDVTGRETGEEGIDDEDENDGGDQVTLPHKEHYGS